ncbi:MAG TPA: 5-oxoprolinase subunit PxpA [Rariglobus sp.]|jgi:UPF0271 protein|nr:5-oxoprolinase subunit PxpA [Rariglobus sp.]
MARIDLNCDLGEGAGHDAELMVLITSASIACGGHAGDESSMRIAVRMARQHGVIVGAHPGFYDRDHFGRRELLLSVDEIVELVHNQVRMLQKIATDEDVEVRYVKPHGALYNLAARTASVAEAIARTVAGLDGNLALYGLAGGELLRAGRAQGLVVKGEVFADRTYQRDGLLTPRSQPGALIDDERQAIEQVLCMVREGRVQIAGGAKVPVMADTLCLHGDGAHAVSFAKSVREALKREGVDVQPCV